MATIRQIRQRIKVAKSIQQITKAMKMVAASKLRRAQERITNARPYAVQMQHVLAGLAGRVDASVHPLLETREAGPDSRTLIISVSGDKGLCGSFNTNAIKAVAQLAVGSEMPVTLGIVGRKGREYFGRRGFSIEFEQIVLMRLGRHVVHNGPSTRLHKGVSSRRANRDGPSPSGLCC